MGDLADNEITWPNVTESLQNLVNTRFRCALSAEQSKLLAEKFPRPENADGLVVPKCNREVWKNMPREAKYADLALATVQKQLATAAVAQSNVVRHLNSIKKALSKDKPDLESQKDLLSQCL